MRPILRVVMRRDVRGGRGGDETEMRMRGWVVVVVVGVMRRRKKEVMKDQVGSL
jgi:hypothetical protein